MHFNSLPPVVKQFAILDPISLSGEGTFWYTAQITVPEWKGKSNSGHTPDHNDRQSIKPKSDKRLHESVLRISRKGNYSSPILAWASAFINVPFNLGAVPNHYHSDVVCTDCAKLAREVAFQTGHKYGDLHEGANNLARVTPNIPVLPTTNALPSIEIWGGSTAGQTHWQDLDRPLPGDIILFDWDNNGRLDHTTIYGGHRQVIPELNYLKMTGQFMLHLKRHSPCKG